METSHITTSLDADGILLATIDMPGRSMNVFSAGLMDSLEQLLDEVDARPEIRGVVIASGKQAFLAGADLEMVRGYTERARRASDEELHLTCGRLGRLFRRLEKTGKPFVAAIDGLALGGGLELALACADRVAGDSRSTQLGLPEVKLGLLPGAGGTQRLPRLIGTSAAFQLLLKGEPVSAQRALELGVLGMIVPAPELLAAARERARELALQPSCAPWDRKQWRLPENPFDFDSAETSSAIAQYVALSDEELAHYPAYRAIMDSVIGGWRKPIEQACRWEMDCFVRLIRDRVAGNMVRTLFLDRQRAAKLLPRGRPAGSLEVATQGPGDDAARALLSAARVAIVEPERLPTTGLLLTTKPSYHSSSASSGAREVAWLRGSPYSLTSFRLTTGVWVSDLTSHGRAVEVCVRNDDRLATEATLEIASALRATPLVTPGGSLLQRLEQAQISSLRVSAPPEERLFAVALAAIGAWVADLVPDTGLADTAAVVAGFHPAYTGGPFSYLNQHTAAELYQRAEKAQAKYGDLFAIPRGLDRLLASIAQVSG